ncbi:hypothetical protein IAD21_03485 [Abditibacteriota bacterium]|nr:hypothetical protein IAD21_03485 [Abditibacteriota bacterium]
MQSPFSDSNAYAARSNDARFGYERYILKRKILQAFGATLYLYGPDEQLIMWGQKKAFKLKDDLRFFNDDTQSQEIIRVAARNILDFSSAFDVFDSQTNQKIGAFKRKGLKSAFMQDSWLILDNEDREIGQVQEDSAFLGMLRRYVDYVSLILPQKYTATLNGVTVGLYSRHKNFLSSRMDLDFSADTNAQLDRRLGLAMAMLLEAIESKN